MSEWIKCEGDAVLPEQPLTIKGMQGNETYKIDDHTIGIRPKWIKCTDRLPKNGESVGYTFDGKNIRHDISYPGFNGSWESENSLGYYISEKNVTHWMPLPAPPHD